MIKAELNPILSVKLGKHLLVADAIRSEIAIRNGIENIPNQEQLENLRALCVNIYDPIYEAYGIRIPFASMFRNPEVNKRTGGSKTSRHMRGEAVDLDADTMHKFGISNPQLFDWLLTKEFDQLIWEYGNDESPAWVHVSWSRTKNRNEVLRARRVDKKTVYETYSRELA